jgi:hypothetical protein
MLKSRDELIYLLTEAAELEHLLCCQYLFAAFSLKRDISEGLSWEQLNHVNGWTQTILLVARQEMEHLGLANNLLTAIGGAPHFQRPNFPQPAKYYPRPMILERFSENTIKRFICFERPIHITPEDAFCLEGEHIVDADADDENGNDVAPYPVAYKTVGDLYEKILWGFENLPLSDQELFVGPPDAQVGGDTLDLNFARVGAQGGVYDVTLFPVTDRASARHAIELIIEQGEGTPVGDEHSHYQRFRQILADFRSLRDADAPFEPARNVVTNPLLRHHQGESSGTIITHPQTRAVMDVFNAAYETMLFLLIRYYTHTDETATELKALKYAAFFPMMTMAIRPLSEVLTVMPAWNDGGDATAGPSFEISRNLHFLPHKRSAWVLLHERLQQLADRCRQLSQDPDVPARLGYIAESLNLVAAKFRAATDL